MRIGASRADRAGFTVFIVLLSLLAALLIADQFGDNNVESADAEVSTLAAGLDVGSAPEPTAVETTEPIPLPTATPTAAPTPIPTATPTPDTEPEPASESDGDGAADDAGSAPSSQASTSGATTAAAPAQSSTQQAAVPNPQPAATEVPNPQPSEPLPEATEVPNPQPGTAPVGNVPPPNAAGGTFQYTLTATVASPSLHTTPGGPTFTPSLNGLALPAQNPTVFGNPLVYPVLAGTPEDGSGWAQVRVPQGGNNGTAWVQTSQFRWGSSNRMIQINVSNNTVTVFEGSNVLLTTSAVTGKSSSRTPIATGWVEETMAGPSAAYGPLLISLGLWSTDLSSFGGSPYPKIALHGTNNPSLMGTHNSNGCIRVPNNVITQIANMMPAGSKVIITS